MTSQDPTRLPNNRNDRHAEQEDLVAGLHAASMSAQQAGAPLTEEDLALVREWLASRRAQRPADGDPLAPFTTQPMAAGASVPTTDAGTDRDVDVDHTPRRDDSQEWDDPTLLPLFAGPDVDSDPGHDLIVRSYSMSRPPAPPAAPAPVPEQVPQQVSLTAGRARSMRPLVATSGADHGEHRGAPSHGHTRGQQGGQTGGQMGEQGGWDWRLVAQYRAEVSTRLTARLEKAGSRVSEQDREQIGLDVIEEFVKAEAEDRVSTGRPAWAPAVERALKVALHAALFGLGRLQPLVDRVDVENIVILARREVCTVWLELVDGTVAEADPVADSEDELREFLADLGARQNRPFTEARPHLDLRLPGGARLAAGSWVMAYTSVVIRRHGMRQVSMEDMVTTHQACGPVVADFLAACVRAGKSIVVAGVQGSGKTTWVRALCSCIPPWEMIGTFETEYELHLHELPERHRIVHAWEHRPGSGEVGIDGRQAGEFSLEKALHHSFRFNLARQIVGEVRGPEVWNMLKAMESGPGSISTTHARSAEHTIEKLVSCAMEKGPQVTRDLAISKLSAAIDIVVYLRSETIPTPIPTRTPGAATPAGAALGGDEGRDVWGDAMGDRVGAEVRDGMSFRKRRWVEEVLVVQPSIDAARGYATTPIFAPNNTSSLSAHRARQQAVPGRSGTVGPEVGAGWAVATGKLDNTLARELARHGFDLEAYKAESTAVDHQWGQGVSP